MNGQWRKQEGERKISSNGEAVLPVYRRFMHWAHYTKRSKHCTRRNVIIEKETRKEDSSIKRISLERGQQMKLDNISVIWSPNTNKGNVRQIEAAIYLKKMKRKTGRQTNSSLTWNSSDLFIVKYGLWKKATHTDKHEQNRRRWKFTYLSAIVKELWSFPLILLCEFCVVLKAHEKCMFMWMLAS